MSFQLPEFNEAEVEKGIKKILEAEANDAPRYDPFKILEDIPEAQKDVWKEAESEKIGENSIGIKLL